MKKTSNTTTTKNVPSFYIFETIETDGQRENRPAGAAFAHRTGGGFNIVIDGQRFVAFPPRAKTAASTVTRGKSA